MSKLFASILLLVLPVSLLQATHNRAGEILVKLIDSDSYTYEVTLITYTNTLASVDRDTLLIYWGDNSGGQLVNRKSQTLLPNNYKKNEYIGTHSYPGPGTFEIFMQDPNRNLGIQNIPQSVFTVFSISTIIKVEGNSRNINTPALLNPPYDMAGVNHPFIHNPAAFDIDGDSISYAITECRGEDGEKIPGYVFPPTTDTFYVDPVIGDLVWNSPPDTGKYNVAMEITEWRNKVAVSKMIRDLQIDVVNTNNQPPMNYGFRDYCLTAGQTITLQLGATDPDNDHIVQEFRGGALDANQDYELATISNISDNFGETVNKFTWHTNYDHIRRLPYQVVIKSQDVTGSGLNLIDSDNMFIKVNAPAIHLLPAKGYTDSIVVRWKKPEYLNHSGYYLYRKTDSTSFTFDSCQTGLPPNSGYELIADITNENDTVYSDIHTISPGVVYCYRISAYFNDGAESYISNEICKEIPPGVPAILQTSVIVSDDNTGEIFLSWASPQSILDTINLPDYQPFSYVVERADSSQQNYTEIARISSNNLQDTTYTDTSVGNTNKYPYYYRISLYDRNGVLWGLPETASTQYAVIEAGDNQLRITPEKVSFVLNKDREFSRTNDSPVNFTALRKTAAASFIDNKLENGTRYYYRHISNDFRLLYGTEYHVKNISHIYSGIPIDTIAPCTPRITSLQSDCDLYINSLQWALPNDTCLDDIVSYNLYYSAQQTETLNLLGSGINKHTFNYMHSIDTGNYSPAGCYAVSAIDSFGNESALSSVQCIDICSFYELPNIFTPGNNSEMDVYVSNNSYGFVKEVEMQIFNRWGQLIYETNDPDINWDGRNQFTGKMVSSGVYLYNCVVYEPRISGIEHRTIHGFIHVYPD